MNHRFQENNGSNEIWERNLQIYEILYKRACAMNITLLEHSAKEAYTVEVIRF